MARQAATEPAPTPTPTEVPGGLSSLALIGLATLLLFQALRVLFPLAYNLGERTSFVSAGLFALVLSLSPFLAPLLIGPLGHRRTVALAVSGLALARLGIQVIHPVPLWLASAAVVLGLFALTAVVVAIRGGRRLAAGIVLGLAVDTALRSAYWTWDYAWQDGGVPVALTVAAGGAAAILAFRVPLEDSPPASKVLGLTALGPFLFLQLLFFQSPAFVASGADTTLVVGTLEVLLADLWALWWIAAVDVRGREGQWEVPLLGLVAVLVAILLPLLEGSVLLGVVLFGVAPTVILVARALDVSPVGRAGPLRASAAVGLGSFTFVLLTLLYYLHYDSPLPFPNEVLPAMAAAIIAAAALRRKGTEVEPPPSRGLALVPLALLVIPVGMLVARTDPQPAAELSGTFRLVDYNIHNGVSPTGQLDPEAIARVIEAEGPDVVVLNEVNRGWAIAGTIDVAEWLSQRLDLPYVYGQAADGQFGNAVMSRFQILEVERVSLPKAGGPMLRNATRATLHVGAGRTVDVIAVHLDHRDEGPATRLTQIEVLLDAWGGEPATVIAGDMNARPESDEIAALAGAGLVSAQDVSGDPSRETFPSSAPDRRIDYVFGTTDITFSDFRIPRTRASDHLPLSVTVALG